MIPHSTHSKPSNQASASIRIGCAGWSLSSAVQASFPLEGTHLQRYAQRFAMVEINTSFYRPHRPDTYARWRDSVPNDFRFSVKMPRKITHELRLQHVDESLHRFLEETSHLEEKLGCLLVQLPPSLRFDPASAASFFDNLCSHTDVSIVCEPRHRTWFDPDASSMLESFGIARVIADPAPISWEAPLVNADTVYVRLHGSPVIYHSAYSGAYLDKLAAEFADERRRGRNVWCVFDNTASGAAVPNALSLMARLERNK